MNFLKISFLLLATNFLFPCSLAFVPASDPLVDSTLRVARTEFLARKFSSIYNRCSNVVRMLPAGYSHCLLAFPLATESVTAGAMAGLGDYLAQTKQQTATSKHDRRSPINTRRNFHFVLKGLGEGVLWSFWYRFAEHWSQIMTVGLLQCAGLLSTTSPYTTKTLRMIISVVLDLLVACPVIYATWDIPFLAIVSGKPVRRIPSEIREKIGPMLRASMLLWMPVNIVIYSVPIQYRVMLSSAADVVWQSAVSAIVVGSKHEDAFEESSSGTAANPSVA